MGFCDPLILVELHVTVFHFYVSGGRLVGGELATPVAIQSDHASSKLKISSEQIQLIFILI
jgi:hypothetical protein